MMQFKQFVYICLSILLLPLAGLAQDTVIPLWQNGAPGFENRRNEPEQAKDYWVKNIHNPSLTVFTPPKDKANGAAVVICPGGGHRLLVYTAEGVDPAKYLNNLGVTVFVLKYRLGRDSASPYKIDVHAKQDGYRAMRLVRSMATRYGLDTNRIGMMGFSAGGEVVDMIAYGEDAPPVFLLAANDDVCCSPSVVKLLERYREAKIPVELHLYTQGDHGFNMGYRSKLKTISSWPQRMADWLEDNNYLHPAPAKRMKMH
jgi:acetyl esterase/lipase